MNLDISNIRIFGLDRTGYWVIWTTHVWTLKWSINVKRVQLQPFWLRLLQLLQKNKTTPKTAAFNRAPLRTFLPSPWSRDSEFFKSSSSSDLIQPFSPKFNPNCFISRENLILGKKNLGKCRTAIPYRFIHHLNQTSTRSRI